MQHTSLFWNGDVILLPIECGQMTTHGYKPQLKETTFLNVAFFLWEAPCNDPPHRSITPSSQLNTTLTCHLHSRNPYAVSGNLYWECTGSTFPCMQTSFFLFSSKDVNSKSTAPQMSFAGNTLYPSSCGTLFECLGDRNGQKAILRRNFGVKTLAALTTMRHLSLEVVEA